ncbi:MAG TPA: DUF2892 domain-containing protein [Methylophilaceae bacterium]|nr:DUF2892 domain-containing protein [Methylophilaceae bacterium]HQR60790.1 DUF2892 domain-containing protein [Methylophilaceae bacterium]
MKVNVGGIERVLRVAVGLGLVAWALTGGPVWAWIGVVPIVTGAIGNCPAYSIFGISTCSAKK